MIDEYFKEIENTINSFPLILFSTRKFEKVDVDEGFLKIKLVLLNQSQLHIFEYIKINNKPIIENYRYHWQDKNSKVIKRWDNAPHHPNIKTFPHHVHEGEIINPSEQPNINQVLNIISKEMDK